MLKISLFHFGKFYKNKKKSVKVGYLTAQDENILISASRTDNVVNKLVKNKIYEPDLRVEDLLEGDLEAILIFLRNTSFGPDYNFVLRDPGTNNEFNHTVRLDELDFNEVENEPNSEGLFEIKLPKSGNSVLCRLLTMGENEEINKLMSKYPPGVVPPTITTKLERQIVSIDGNQFGNNDFRIIQTLSEILDGDDQIQEMIMVEPTHFVIENLQVTIHSLETYEQSLIHNNYIKKE